jgi:hypothetical protein
MIQSKFVESDRRETIAKVLPVSQKDIDSINLAVNIISDKNISPEDIIDYIQWTRYFLKRMKLICNTNLALGTYPYKTIEVTEESVVLLSSIDEGQYGEDDDDGDDDYDDDDDDFLDEDEDEYEDDDDEVDF